MTRLPVNMATGLTLGDIAVVLTSISALLGGVLMWSTSQVNANSKTNEGRVADMQKALDAVREDADERMNDLRGEMTRQREDWGRQMGDLRATLTQQAQTMHRQETLLIDYARHVGKLERIMAAARLEIPDFETSVIRGNV